MDKQLNVGLTGEEISNIMKAGESHQAHKENTAKSIQSHAMNKINTEPGIKQNCPTPDPTDMEIIEEPTQQHTQ